MDKAKTEGYYTQQRADMFGFVPQQARRILEIGCGQGTFLATLARDDRELWGIELDSDMARHAEKVCHRLLVGDVNELCSQLPENYFDCVICNDVLEHLYAPWDVLRTIHRLLVRDGVVVASIPNIRYIGVFITEKLWQKDFIYRPEGGILDDTHVRFFTSKSMRRMFEQCGYRILRHEGIRPCKSWKEKLFITLSCGFLSDSRYKCFATVAQKI